jgi:serine/threonine-protein kinase
MPPLRRSRASLALAIGGAVSLVLALGVAFVVLRSSSAPARTDAPPAPAVSLAEPAQPATTAASPPPSSVPSASAAPVATAPPKSTARPPVGRPPPASKKSCEIPYVIDAKGQKHFKPECVDN